MKADVLIKVIIDFEQVNAGWAHNNIDDNSNDFSNEG